MLVFVLGEVILVPLNFFTAKDPAKEAEFAGKNPFCVGFGGAIQCQQLRENTDRPGLRCDLRVIPGGNRHLQIGLPGEEPDTCFLHPLPELFRVMAQV